MGSDARFQLADPCQCLVPTPLQFRCHQAVRRINRVVLTEGTVGSMARCFEVPAQGITYFVTLDGRLPLGFDRRRDRAGFEHLEDRHLGSVIDPQAMQRGSA